MTGDSYKKILQCHFLNGTEHNTCFIEVEGDDQPLSGSDVYHFSKPGNHTLRVYDNRAQRDAGAEPAKVLNITIGKCCISWMTTNLLIQLSVISKTTGVLGII